MLEADDGGAVLVLSDVSEVKGLRADEPSRDRPGAAREGPVVMASCILLDVAGPSMLAGVPEREPEGVGLARTSSVRESSVRLAIMDIFARLYPGPDLEYVLGATLVALVAGVAKGVLVDVGE